MSRVRRPQVLRSRLYDLEAQRRARQAGEQRSALVASGDRSERVRTYNFPQVSARARVLARVRGWGSREGEGGRHCAR